MMFRLVCSVFCLSLLCGTGLGAPRVEMAPLEKWANVFGGKECTNRWSVVATEPGQGRAMWTVSANERVIARGEQAVAFRPDGVAIVEVKWRVPEVKEGVVFPVSITVSMAEVAGHTVLATSRKEFHVFPEDPFADRREWVRKLDIRLFDPEKKTVEVLAKAGIAFTGTANIDSFTSAKDGVLVIGEGVSLKDFRGLWDAVVKSAANGVHVVLLAPADGEFALPGISGGDMPRASSMSFRQGDVVKDLDKKLDAEGWAPDGVFAVKGVKVQGTRGGAIGEISGDTGSWPWIEIGFPGRNGKLLICGFPIVGKWDASPAPRFLFARILERLAQERSK